MEIANTIITNLAEFFIVFTATVTLLTIADESNQSNVDGVLIWAAVCGVAGAYLWH